MYRKSILFFIPVTLIYICLLKVMYGDEKRRRDNLCDHLFGEAVATELELRGKKYPRFSFNPPSSSSDSIWRPIVKISAAGRDTLPEERTNSLRELSKKELENRTLQTYLLDKGDTVRALVLDSLYCESLAAHGLHVSTAIGDKPLKFSHHSQIVTGLKNEISLDGYVQYGWWDIVRFIRVKTGLLTVGWLLATGLSLLFLFMKKRAAAEEKPADDSYRIRAAIQVYPSKNTLIYRRREYHLKPTVMKLFDIICNANGLSISMDDMIMKMHGKVEQGGRNRIRQTVIRLRKQLEDIPLQIKFTNNIYRLFYKDDPVDSIDPNIDGDSANSNISRTFAAIKEQLRKIEYKWQRTKNDRVTA